MSFDIHDYQLAFEMFKIGLWMSEVQALVMLQCMDSLSLNPYTMQRIDVLNVDNILKLWTDDDYLLSVCWTSECLCKLMIFVNVFLLIVVI